jgi:KaiC/GvpD/RAD55 family RecA-like ATPase
MTIGDFLKRLDGVKSQKTGWIARCPAHDDRHASLSIKEVVDGRILLKDHAGCLTDEIVAARGLTLADLFIEKQANGDGRVIEATYDYRDEAGSLLFQAVRYTPKDFRQRRPDGAGGFIYDLKGVPRMPYRLPELLAADPSEIVFLVEGEKDVDRLRAGGLVATCSPMGAGKWRDEYAKPLAGRKVAIIPDNDQAGRDHAQAEAKSLHGVAASVKVLTLLGLPDKGDVSDWLSLGGTIETLRAMADAALEWTPGADNGSQPKTDVETVLGRIVTAQTILNTHYAEPKWAVKGLIPEGVTFIAGPPKLGKSIFALNIAVAVAEGGKALSNFDVEHGSVLYLALEDGPRRIQERLLKLTNGRISDKLEVVTEWPRLNQGGLEAIEAWIERRKDARVLIVDTLKMLRPLPTGRDRNAYDADYEAIQPLTKLASQRVGLLIVHHTRKAIAEDPLATVSGSYGLTGAADGVLVLSRRRNRSDATLSVIGRDVEEQELALEFKPDLCLWSTLGKSEEVKRSGERQEVLDLLFQTGEPMSPANIAELLDKTPGAIRALLFKMKNADEIKLFGSKYQLPRYQPPEPTKIRKSEKGKNVTALPETNSASNAPMSNGNKDLEAERYHVTDGEHFDEGTEISSIDKTGNAITDVAQLLKSKDIPALPVKNGIGNAGNGAAIWSDAYDEGTYLEAIDR